MIKLLHFADAHIDMANYGRQDPQTGLPYPNMPGVLSQDIRRPFPEDPDRYQLFFGSFDDDNVPMEDTYLPLIQQSQFCAPCHFGFFWDTLINKVYGVPWEEAEATFGTDSWRASDHDPVLLRIPRSELASRDRRVWLPLAWRRAGPTAASPSAKSATRSSRFRLPGWRCRAG